MNIIGVSGTNGAGKDSVCEFLANQHNWFFVSVSQLLRDELKRQGVPTDRKNTSALSAQWRKQYGLGVLVDKAVEAYASQKKDYAGLVISSLRNPGEADEVHRLGGKVVWVDAEPKMRYQRITSRNRGTEDNKSFEEFLTEEQAEMNHSGHQATLSMQGVKDKSDIFIDNNSNDLKSFYSELADTLKI